MGFFGDLIGRIVTFFEDLFGVNSYSGTLESRIDVEKVLNKFKEKNMPTVNLVQEQVLGKILDSFTDFENAHQNKDPYMVTKLRDRKMEIRKRLANIVVDGYSRRLSLNNPELKKVLEIRSEDERNRKLGQCHHQFLAEAFGEFRSNLKAEMDALYREVGAEFERRLTEKTAELDKQAHTYETLRQQAEDGQLDMNRLEQEAIPVADAVNCMEYLFEKE